MSTSLKISLTAASECAASQASCCLVSFESINHKNSISVWALNKFDFQYRWCCRL